MSEPAPSIAAALPHPEPRLLRGRLAAAARAALCLCVVLTSIHKAAAAAAPSRAWALLTECRSRVSLRASLLAYADSTLPTVPAAAGEAFLFAGQSYARASLRDSAIACFQRTIAARGGEEERCALADALMMRRAEGDIEAALALFKSPPGQPEGAGPTPQSYRARMAWAKFLAGEPQRSYELFLPLEQTPDLGPVWGYRMARAFVEAGDAKRALAALVPLAIASRGQDEEIMSLVDRAFEKLGDKRRVEAAIGNAIAARDRLEGRLVEAMSGRRVRFGAADGFELGGVVAPADQQLRRAAVVLCAPRDTLESYDSLTVAMGRAGWAVMLMEVRGSGWSAAPSCPLPDAWGGREDAMQAVCANDVRQGLRALSLAAKIDTSRYLVVGTGPAAPIAVEAAESDPRIPALLLLSPAPAPVERGTLRERIRRLHRPVYFSNGPEDLSLFEVTEALYQAGDRPRSRVADVKAAGSGARPFRDDPAALKRLIAWLEETMPPRAPARPRSR